MKKPVKITLWVLGGLLALIVVALLALPLWIGALVTGVANSVAPGITGTDFKLEQFALNPYSGKIGLAGLTLSNPKGYEEKTAVSVKSLNVSLDFASLLSNKIHIREIVIEEPFVSYVFDSDGTNNFDRILANVNENLGGEKKEEAQEEEAKKDGKKLVIDRLCINGTWVKYRMIKLPIPVPTLTNIGGGDDADGASPEEVKETVWKSIQDKFSAMGNAKDLVKGFIGGGSDAAANATKAATETVNEGAKKAAEAAGDATKKATEAAGDAAKKATEAAGDAAKKAAEGLKKLNPFGK